MRLEIILPFAAWATGIATAHSNIPTEQTVQLARSLYACLVSSNHKERHDIHTARRASMVEEIRKARNITAPPRRKRGTKEDLEHWLSSHEQDITNPAWRSKNDEYLFNYHTNEEPNTSKAACIVTPESIYGPYWHEGQIERQDIRAGQEGIYMRLALQVIDVSTCKPLEGAQVDVWQANALGHYSDCAGEWLRGWQRTGKWGTADFDTIFPGHYPGRTTHTHVAVREENDKRVLHAGQIYYDDWPRTLVEKTEPYTKNEKLPTANKDDGVFIEMAATKDYDPFAKWAWLGPNYPYDGIISWIVMGVNTTATVEQPPPQKRDRGLFDTKLRR